MIANHEHMETIKRKGDRKVKKISKREFYDRLKWVTK